MNKAHPGEQFKYLKVVILPGSDDPERPTISDIALTENDFQLYSDGRSEYTSMNKTLTLFKNEKKGIELEAMLIQDPSYSGLSDKEFKKAVEEFKKKYFRPLQLMNEFLNVNGIKDDFVRVEKKWTAFRDASEKIFDQLEKERTLVRYNIDESEKGLIQSAAFNLMKLDDHSAVRQRNQDLMRDIFKWIEADKKEFLKIGRIDDNFDEIKDPDERFRKWNEENADKIINSIKKLDGLADRKKIKEGPIRRLEDILQKLEHEELDYERLTFMERTQDLPEAKKLANSIQTVSKQLYRLLSAIEEDDKNTLEELLRLRGKNRDN